MPRTDPSRARQRLAAAQAADAPAADWVRDHLDAVYRYARRRLPREDAEDVTQQSFEALFRAEAEGRAPRDSGAYLLGTARRRVADHLRRRARRPEPVRLPAEWERFDEHALPATALETAELRDLVQVALGLLPGSDAQMLLARCRGNVPVAEIAARHGLTPKAAEMRLRRARQAFVEHFRRVGRDWLADVPDADAREPRAKGEVTP
jgi:RNA polymerase sigma-70 factor (ECF subfamily)